MAVWLPRLQRSSLGQAALHESLPGIGCQGDCSKAQRGKCDPRRDVSKQTPSHAAGDRRPQESGFQKRGHFRVFDARQMAMQMTPPPVSRPTAYGIGIFYGDGPDGEGCRVAGGAEWQGPVCAALRGIHICFPRVPRSLLQMRNHRRPGRHFIWACPLQAPGRWGAFQDDHRPSAGTCESWCGRAHAFLVSIRCLPSSTTTESLRRSAGASTYVEWSQRRGLLVCRRMCGKNFRL